MGIEIDCPKFSHWNSEGTSICKVSDLDVAAIKAIPVNILD